MRTRPATRFIRVFGAPGPLLLLALLSFQAVLINCGSPSTNSQSKLSDPATCSAIATEYADALPSARICEPGVSTSCAAQRPFPRYEQGAVVGLWACPTGSGVVAVNPARTTTLDALLTRYTSQGCEIRYGVPCPGPGGPGAPPPPCQATGRCP